MCDKMAALGNESTKAWEAIELDGAASLDICSDASGEGSSSTTSTASALSLLDALKSPEPSTLARPRKIKRNPPPIGAKRSQ